MHSVAADNLDPERSSASTAPTRLPSADSAIQVMLIAFAATVIGTRWFLELTGFPKVGGGDLHIAHALWGGLLLFGGALLPLIWLGRRLHLAAAVLTGAGMGLFIDEVGKFITTRNDYFYPAAAPIIYATFLLGLLLLLGVRRLPGERVASPMRRPAGPFRRWWTRRRDQWLGGRGLRAATIVALLVAGVGSFGALVFFAILLASEIPASDVPLLALVLLHVAVDGVSGMLLIGGAIALLLGRTRTGATLASVGLLVALAIGDVLSFYLRQFDSIAVVLFHFSLLWALSRLPDTGRGSAPVIHSAPTSEAEQ